MTADASAGSGGSAETGSAGAGAPWTDPERLVNGDPEEVWGLLHSAGEQQAPAARVYRASAHLHRDAGPAVRRQLLALDAARYGDRELAARITAVPVPDAAAPAWGVQWATGTGLDSRYRHTMTGRHTTRSGDRLHAVASAVMMVPAVVVSCGSDRAVRIWDLTTGHQTGEPLTGHTGAVNAVATTVARGWPVAVTGSADTTVRMWDLTTGRQVGESLTGHTGAVNAVATTVIGNRPVAVTGSDDTTVRVWDLTTGQQIGQPLTGHTGPIAAVATVVLDGHAIAVTSGYGGRSEGDDAGHDGALRVWDATTGEQVGEPVPLPDDCGGAVAVALVDGYLVAVAAGGEDGSVRVWNLGADEPVAELMAGHSGAVTALTIGHAGSRPVVVTGGEDGTVRVVDLATRMPVGVPVVGRTGPVETVDTAELDGRLLIVTGGADGAMEVWDVTEAPPVGEPLEGHAHEVNTVTPALLDGRPLYQPLTGHPGGDDGGAGNDGDDGDDGGGAVATGMVNDRPVVATASGNEVRIRNPATGEPIGSELVFPAMVSAVAITPDGRLRVEFGCDTALFAPCR
ncbi:WD40 repeat domain-containing protein [Streptomyces qinzhouensis]|uniref:WD40 repeat domain-containing protein n=1 Tax=Streptomyces qinzhouensis TaxID=2599401 RepID=A0A5B8J2D7_9ACTN|nr:WD40 repeat domain-containing protein [Streptomyces qinzhouensis]QDY75326.1 WD40 repeat domain-containing protein [Streptomyces qinzhouensis]